jgi:hypothetical protein
MRLTKNKKSKYYLTIVSIGMIIALGTLFYYIAKNQDAEKKVGVVGTKSASMISAYRDAEKILFFIDMAAKYAAEDAYLLAGYNGLMPREGVEEGSPCKLHYNWVMWDFENPACLPFNGNMPSQNFNDAYSEAINKAFTQYLQLAQDMPIPVLDFDVTTFEDNGKLTVTGDSSKPMIIDIMRYVPGANQTYNSMSNILAPSQFRNDPRVQYLLANNKYVAEPGFLDAVASTAEAIGANPLHLMILMYLESKISPKAIEPKYGATGLIQFYPGKGMAQIGKTQSELVQMTATEQMQYVKMYLLQNKETYLKKSGINEINSLVQLYLLVLYPGSAKDAKNPDALVWAAGSSATLNNPTFGGGNVYVKDINAALLRLWNTIPAGEKVTTDASPGNS